MISCYAVLRHKERDESSGTVIFAGIKGQRGVGELNPRQFKSSDAESLRVKQIWSRAKVRWQTTVSTSSVETVPFS